MKLSAKKALAVSLVPLVFLPVSVPSNHSSGPTAAPVLQTRSIVSKAGPSRTPSRTQTKTSATVRSATPHPRRIVMAKPAYTSDAMWNFWLKFDKKYPATKLGGTYAPKPGYHNRRSQLHGWDYSKDEFQKDRLGSSELCAAIDLTMSPAAMKTFSARLLASGKDKNDPRGNYLREFFGTINGTKVTGWDFQKLSLTSSDSSHLWHIHVSIVR